MNVAPLADPMNATSIGQTKFALLGTGATYFIDSAFHREEE
jgi:hypothetical protein